MSEAHTRQGIQSYELPEGYDRTQIACGQIFAFPANGSLPPKVYKGDGIWENLDVRTTFEPLNG